MLNAPHYPSGKTWALAVARDDNTTVTVNLPAPVINGTREARMRGFDDDVQRALDSLAPDFRAAVVLCDIEGLSYEEIGATLGVKLGTVRSRIHRGRQALRDHLAATRTESGARAGSRGN